MVPLIVIAVLFVLTMVCIGMAAHYRDKQSTQLGRRLFRRFAVLAIVGLVALLVFTYVNRGTLQHLHF